MDATFTQLLKSACCSSFKSGYTVYSLGDDRDNKWILEAGILEVLGAVVEDEVDTSQLLEGLKSTAGEKTLANSALEAVRVASFRNAHLIAVIGLNLSKFLNKRWVSRVETAELA